MVKNPPAMQEMQETWVQSLSREDPLEQEIETHSSILAWRIPPTKEPGGLPWSHTELTRLNQLSRHTLFHFTDEEAEAQSHLSSMLQSIDQN